MLSTRTASSTMMPTSAAFLGFEKLIFYQTSRTPKVLIDTNARNLHAPQPSHRVLINLKAMRRDLFTAMRVPCDVVGHFQATKPSLKAKVMETAHCREEAPRSAQPQGPHFLFKLKKKHLWILFISYNPPPTEADCISNLLRHI